MGNDMIRCDFCAHRCLLKEGQTGICGIRRNDNGVLHTLGYGEVVSMAVDPIEKKPLYHFHPGSRIFSIALFGCNFRCPFCQNAEIAHPEFFGRRQGRRIAPEEMVVRWKESGTSGIAFTYSEPSVWQDYLIDVAVPIRAAGGWTVMVTNGYFTPEATKRLIQVVDAFNIDLKGGDNFYRSLCKARHDPVLETIRRVVPHRHIEVTSLFIDGVHTIEEIEELGFELSDAGVSVWHISRFHPAFRMQDHPPTSENRLKELLDRVRGTVKIPFIYGGNSRQLEYQQTRCPKCATVLVDRSAFATRFVRLESGRCPNCGESIYGEFDKGE